MLRFAFFIAASLLGSASAFAQGAEAIGGAGPVYNPVEATAGTTAGTVGQGSIGVVGTTSVGTNLTFVTGAMIGGGGLVGATALGVVAEAAADREDQGTTTAVTTTTTTTTTTTN